MSYRHCSVSTLPICTRRSVQWALSTARFLPMPVSRYFPIRSNRSASCAATCLHSVARLRKFIPCPRQILLSLSVWISPNQSEQAPLNPGLLNARARIVWGRGFRPLLAAGLFIELGNKSHVQKIVGLDTSRRWIFLHDLCKHGLHALSTDVGRIL